MRLRKYAILGLAAIAAVFWGGLSEAKESPEHTWALAASAIIVEMNRDHHDLLGFGELTPEHVAKHTKALQEWWGISSREDLIRNLDWLAREGHRREFEEIGRTINLLDASQITTFQGYLRGLPDIFKKTALIRSHYREFGDKSLKGWDFCRYIYLCRAGYACGYFTEEEAWDRIMPVARRLQRTFTSWSDLALNYQIGRWFWKPLQTPDELNAVNTATSKLYGGIWKTTPWDTSLPESLTVRMLRPVVNWLAASFGKKKGS